MDSVQHFLQMVVAAGMDLRNARRAPLAPDAPSHHSIVKRFRIIR